jgi:hypothetical protein
MLTSFLQFLNQKFENLKKASFGKQIFQMMENFWTPVFLNFIDMGQVSGFTIKTDS